MTEKRWQKLDSVADRYEHLTVVTGDPDAEIGIMAWGACKGAVLEAVRQLQGQGVKVRAVVPRLLWPFPLQHVEPALEGLKTIHVVELSYSAQFHTFLKSQLRAELGGRLVRHSRAGGSPLGANEVVAWVQGADRRAAAD